METMLVLTTIQLEVIQIYSTNSGDSSIISRKGRTPLRHEIVF